MAQQMNIFQNDMSYLLTKFVELGDDPFGAACDWLKNNQARYMAWLPNETACTSGKGLVNACLGRKSFHLCFKLPSGKATSSRTGGWRCLVKELAERISV